MPRLLRLSEAAELIGLSPVTLRRLIKAGRLPAVRPTPRTVRIREEDLSRLMERA
jgi:excisionase family DNA binding protein